MSVTITCVRSGFNVVRKAPRNGSPESQSLPNVYVVECKVQNWEVFSKEQLGDYVNGKAQYSTRDMNGYHHNDDSLYANLMICDNAFDEGICFILYLGARCVKINAIPLSSFNRELMNDKDTRVHFTIAEWMLKNIAHRANELNTDQFSVTFFENY